MDNGDQPRPHEDEVLIDGDAETLAPETDNSSMDPVQALRQLIAQAQASQNIPIETTPAVPESVGIPEAQRSAIQKVAAEMIALVDVTTPMYERVAELRTLLHKAQNLQDALDTPEAKTVIDQVESQVQDKKAEIENTESTAYESLDAALEESGLEYSGSELGNVARSCIVESRKAASELDGMSEDPLLSVPDDEANKPSIDDVRKTQAKLAKQTSKILGPRQTTIERDGKKIPVDDEIFNLLKQEILMQLQLLEEGGPLQRIVELSNNLVLNTFDPQAPLNVGRARQIADIQRKTKRALNPEAIINSKKGAQLTKDEEGVIQRLRAIREPLTTTEARLRAIVLQKIESELKIPQLPEGELDAIEQRKQPQVEIPLQKALELREVTDAFRIADSDPAVLANIKACIQRAITPELSKLESQLSSLPEGKDPRFIRDSALSTGLLTKSRTGGKTVFEPMADASPKQAQAIRKMRNRVFQIRNEQRKSEAAEREAKKLNILSSFEASFREDKKPQFFQFPGGGHILLETDLSRGGLPVYRVMSFEPGSDPKLSEIEITPGQTAYTGPADNPYMNAPRVLRSLFAKGGITSPEQLQEALGKTEKKTSKPETKKSPKERSREAGPTVNVNDMLRAEMEELESKQDPEAEKTLRGIVVKHNSTTWTTVIIRPQGDPKTITVPVQDGEEKEIQVYQKYEIVSARSIQRKGTNLAQLPNLAADPKKLTSVDFDNREIDVTALSESDAQLLGLQTDRNVFREGGKTTE